MLRLNDRPHEIIGVMSAPATYPRLTDAWVPVAFTAQQRSEEERGSEYLDVVARLKPGLSGERARAGSRASPTRSGRSTTADAPRWTLPRCWPLEADLVRDSRPILLTVFGAVGLGAAGRVCERREPAAVAGPSPAARAGAPGRHRRRAGPAASVSCSSKPRPSWRSAERRVCCSPARPVPLLARAVAATFPLVDAPRMDLSVLAFALAAIIVSSLLFGLIPAWQLSAHRLAIGLSTRRRVEAPAAARVRLLVGPRSWHSRVVRSLVGAGLLVRSFARVMPSIRDSASTHRLKLRVALPVRRYPAAPQRDLVYNRLIALASRAARRAQRRHRLGAAARRHEEHGARSKSRAGLWRAAQTCRMPTGESASPRYFAAIGIRLVAGRLFDGMTPTDAARVAIVDEAAAAMQLGRAQARIGQRLSNDGPGPKTWRDEIVGVVRTVHHDSLDEPARGTVYLPLAQRPTASAFAVVADGRRSAGAAVADCAPPSRARS